MSLIKYEPNCARGQFPATLGSVFNDFFPGVFSHWDVPSLTFRPAVDVVEEDDRVILKADMPGMDKGDVKVVVQDGRLSIEGSRKESHDEKSQGFTRSERFVGNFSRSFNLPTWADASKISANYKNGVLEVLIPKTEKARPKEIEIQVG